jgi:hypothetical protein
MPSPARSRLKDATESTPTFDHYRRAEGRPQVSWGSVFSRPGTGMCALAIRRPSDLWCRISMPPPWHQHGSRPVVRRLLNRLGAYSPPQASGGAMSLWRALARQSVEAIAGLRRQAQGEVAANAGCDQEWLQPCARPRSVPMSCELRRGARVLRGRLHGPGAALPASAL